MILAERCSAVRLCGSNFINPFIHRWIKTINFSKQLN